MAIIDSVPGVEVSICVDNVPLKEYPDDEQEGEHTASRYVESVSGTGFTIKVEVTEAAAFVSDRLALYVYIDGVYFTGLVLAKPDVEVLEGFHFAALETAADGLKFNDEDARVENLGEIWVDMLHVRYLGLVPTKLADPLRPSSKTRAGDLGIVSEKALKGRALSHSVGYEEEIIEKSESSLQADLDFVNGKTAAATFRLRYCSLECLKSLLIVERTPPPIPLEERDFDSLTREEMQEVHKRGRDRAQAEKAAQEANVKVKRELEDDNPRPRKTTRPSGMATQLEIGEASGGFRKAATDPLGRVEPEIIEID